MSLRRITRRVSAPTMARAASGRAGCAARRARSIVAVDGPASPSAATTVPVVAVVPTTASYIPGLATNLDLVVADEQVDAVPVLPTPLAELASPVLDAGERHNRQPSHGDLRDHGTTGLVKRLVSLEFR